MIKIKHIKKIILFLLFILLFSFIYYWQNNYVVTSYYEYESTQIPNSFNGFKILQISDWHNQDFSSQLIAKTKKTNPDIVIITGDFLDVYHPNPELANAFLDELISRYPVYFVTGNHEEAIFKRNIKFKHFLKTKQITFLDNESTTIIKNGEAITIYGIRDFTYNKNVEYDLKTTINPQDSKFSILLAHQPQYFEEYSKHNINLVFSGHEHGGQIRLPFIGSIYSHQGWFAEWTSGAHTINNTTMIVSRGLGNSEILPIRLFNQPELVLTTLIKT